MLTAVVLICTAISVGVVHPDGTVDCSSGGVGVVEVHPVKGTYKDLKDCAFAASDESRKYTGLAVKSELAVWQCLEDEGGSLKGTE